MILPGRAPTTASSLTLLGCTVITLFYNIILAVLHVYHCRVLSHSLQYWQYIMVVFWCIPQTHVWVPISVEVLHTHTAQTHTHTHTAVCATVYLNISGAICPFNSKLLMFSHFNYSSYKCVYKLHHFTLMCTLYYQHCAVSLQTAYQDNKNHSYHLWLLLLALATGAGQL